MSFWSKLGKTALKVAPVAAGFIPGVGPLASMAIGAGSAGLSKKLEGGSMKDSLLAGGIGGATGYASGKLGDMTTSKPKGLGPSQEALNSPWANPADAMATTAGSGVLKGGNSVLTKALMTGIGLTPLLGLMGGGKEGDHGPGSVPGVYGQNGKFGSFEQRNPNLGAAIQRGKAKGRRDFAMRSPLKTQYAGRY